ncbi:hypothetical protein [Salinibaculum rarum]|uniref:hypothetical protein n=1 Tax=Salinibaculum rarum TaxID=3058903 RepID=UPI00265FB74B|nr:hypothetical protein [Salinibaculum sp. KK48]
MVLAALSRLRTRLAEWWSVDDPEDRIEGTGEVYLDPAYNGRYEAERNLNDLADAETQEKTDRDS